MGEEFLLPLEVWCLWITQNLSEGL